MPTIWFGTKEKMQYAKVMLSELPSSMINWNSVLQYQNGGADVVASYASHRAFDASWNGNADEVGIIKDYQQGLYGSGLIYFTLPHAERRNLFAPNWAAPRLIGTETNGWPELYTTAGTQVATASNVYSQPAYGRTYTTTATLPDALATTKRFFIPLPPNKTLHLGWSGSQTGSGQVYYRVLNSDGTWDASVALTALSATASTRINANVAGSTGIGVEVYLYGAGTVTITSLVAQLWDTGVSPTLTGNFISGKGYSGMKFANGISESILQDAGPNNEHFTINTTLVEVGQWQPS